MTAALIAGVILGLLGSLHCIGMCGPIALSLPVHHHRGIKKLLLILSYNAGRMTTYAAFGAVAGVAGEALLLATSGRVLSVVAGLLVIASVIAITGKSSRLAVLPFFRKISSTLSDVLAGRRSQTLFVVGLLNGLLPCGLVYMALTAAVAQGDALSGAVLMAFFGAGTVPAMLALPYAGGWISMRFRNAARRAVPYFVALTGLMLVLRGMGLGIPYLSPSFGDAGTTCHSTVNQPVVHQCVKP